MKRRTLLAVIPLFVWLTACAQPGKPETDQELRGMGMVVAYALAPGASQKEGVQAITDAGNRLFGPSLMNQQGGGVSSSGGGSKMSFPRWVRVTWREDTTSGERWTTGKVVGDHKVEVLSRIPEEVFAYVAAAPGRAIVLRFWLQDDGVLFAWDVQVDQVGHHTYTMHGGDFQAAERFNGKIVKKGWYIDKKSGEKIETDYWTF